MNPAEQAQELWDQANELRGNGQVREAATLYQEAVPLFVEAGELREACRCHQQRGVCFKATNLEEAVRAYRAALAVAEMTEEEWGPVEQANILRDWGLALIYHWRLTGKTNYLTEGREILDRSCNLLKELGNDPGGYGITSVKCGLIEMYLGEPGWEERSRDLFYAGIALLDQAGEQALGHQATARLHLAEWAVAQRRYGEAISHLKFMLDYMGPLKDKDHRRHCQRLQLLAHCYIKCNEIAAANAALQTAEPLFQALEPEDQIIVAMDTRLDETLYLLSSEE